MSLFRNFLNKPSNDSSRPSGLDSNEPKDGLSAQKILGPSSDNLANIRALLLEGFSVKEIKSLINRLPYFKLFYDRLPVDTKKYLSKNELVEVLLRELKGREEFTTLLLLAQELKP